MADSTQEVPMALSELAKKIRRFSKLHAQNKCVTKELEELKAYFKEKSGGEDTVFSYADIEVPVTKKHRDGYTVGPSDYLEVTCRKVAKAAT
jgi:hypothetical protein